MYTDTYSEWLVKHDSARETPGLQIVRRCEQGNIMDVCGKST